MRNIEDAYRAAGYRQNEARCLAAFHEDDALTVAELREATGLGQPSVCQVMTALVAEGVVTRTNQAPQGKGRPFAVYHCPPQARRQSRARLQELAKVLE